MKSSPIFDGKKRRAFAMMRAKGMWHSTYAPPCHRLLWNLGFEVAPPPLSPFMTNLFSFTIVYTPFWGIVMWFVFWKAQYVDLLSASITILSAGLLFSLVMSVFQLWRKKANHLPEWEQI
ncbi:hypothetical protein J3D56_000323 [Erwinia persicina]|jgi:hypothetical protein|uniref:DUF6404 family protein n=1 Tax=Erwinia TaxID=551 RepID=UPI0020A16032|nr:MULTISPECIES: DUF6404 family protein [Erwinia]MCP1436887.1 hypothetical protein [Erwinia persicina]MDN8540255.1 DUF6404 family protein [Erwinia sp. BC051422]